MLQNIQVSVIDKAINKPVTKVTVDTPDMHLYCSKETVTETARYFQSVCLKFGLDRVINSEYTDTDEEFAKGGIKNVSFDNWAGSSFVLRFTHEATGHGLHHFMTVYPKGVDVQVGFFQKAAF